MPEKKITAVDVFCGIGGLSYGLKKAGIAINAGIDVDDTCRYTYESNCNSKFINKDIQEISGAELKSFYGENDTKVLVGCAPCQPFSSYTYKKNKEEDNRWQLLYEFSRLVEEVKPVIVSMENVPTLLNFKEAPVFESSSSIYCSSLVNSIPNPPGNSIGLSLVFHVSGCRK